MGKISVDDLKAIAMMEKAGVLQNVDGHKLPTPNGAILLFCGDGDQLLHLLPETINTIFIEEDEVRPHALALNGGALCIPRSSPVYKADPCFGTAFLKNIRASRQLKGIDTVVLMAHAPCGMAAQHGIAFENVIALSKEAKVRVLEENAGMKVACFIHIDRNGAGKKVYFLHGASWRAWNALSPEERERRYGAPAPSEAAEVY